VCRGEEVQVCEYQEDSYQSWISCPTRLSLCSSRKVKRETKRECEAVDNLPELAEEGCVEMGKRSGSRRGAEEKGYSWG
jgi:hypothetical protein